jgi:hypothetical protein
MSQPFIHDDFLLLRETMRCIHHNNDQTHYSSLF